MACLCALGMAGVAQEPPTLRVTTHLVQINLVAHDKKGQPVADLTRDDFVLVDQGQPQKISIFSVESSRPLGGRRPPNRQLCRRTTSRTAWSGLPARPAAPP